MARKEHLSNEEEAERAAQLREKKARGETLTRREAGFLGAVASRRSTAREREEAKAAGREDEFEARHRTKSWMAGDDTRAPTLSGDTERELARIRAKQDRGEPLTRHESGVLGGVARAGEDD